MEVLVMADPGDLSEQPVFPNPLQHRRVIRKPIIQTDIGFYHEASHAGASRNRIMEDTEDWRPRTGTSQSRSFHILPQITGTEAMPEDVVSKKATVKPHGQGEQKYRSGRFRVNNTSYSFLCFSRSCSNFINPETQRHPNC
ncbi:hypothetical protein QTP86_033699 [Hemibagrus guttatus]|nr:hypothetical protein QTP86_033699 [Hemibagrus guttatus]